MLDVLFSDRRTAYTFGTTRHHRPTTRDTAVDYSIKTPQLLVSPGVKRLGVSKPAISSQQPQSFPHRRQTTTPAPARSSRSPVPAPKRHRPRPVPYVTNDKSFRQCGHSTGELQPLWSQTRIATIQTKYPALGMAARTGNMAVAAFPVSERHCLGTPSRRPAARNTRVHRGAVCSISTSREKGATTFLHGVAVPLRVPLVGPLQPAPLEAIYDYDYDGEGFSPGGLSLDRDGSTLGLEVAEEAAVGLKARFAEALEGVPTWPRTLLVRERPIPRPCPITPH